MQDKIGTPILLKTSPSDPAHSCVLQLKFQDGFEGNPEGGPLGIYMKSHFANHGVGTLPVSQVDLQKFPFWGQQSMSCNS